MPCNNLEGKTNKYFLSYITHHPINAINQHKGNVLTSYI